MIRRVIFWKVRMEVEVANSVNELFLFIQFFAYLIYLSITKIYTASYDRMNGF
jgi:hypothetical protein